MVPFLAITHKSKVVECQKYVEELIDILNFYTDLGKPKV